MGKPTRSATVEYHLRVAANQKKERDVIYDNILVAHDTNVRSALLECPALLEPCRVEDYLS